MKQFPIGLRYMVESAFWFSIMSILVKWAGQTVPFQEIVFARSLVAFVLSYGMLRASGTSPWGVNKPLLFLRGAFGFGGLCSFYYAITHLPLADATVIQYTNPVFVAMLAGVVLKEHFDWRTVIGAAVCIGGVVMIAQPTVLFGGDGPRLETFHVLVAMAGALFSAGAYTAVRKLGETDEPIVVVFWFPMVALPFAFPWALSTGYVPDLGEIGILLCVGVSTQIAQIRMTQGLKLEHAARATAMTYLQIVFAFVWGMLLFGEFPSLVAFLGAAIIIVTTFAIARSRQS